MYLRGSRAIDAARPDSDWDFFVVLSGDRNAALTDVLLKCGNVDVALYGVAAFRRLVAVHTCYVIDALAQRPWVYANKIDFWRELTELRAATPVRGTSHWAYAQLNTCVSAWVDAVSVIVEPRVWCRP